MKHAEKITKIFEGVGSLISVYPVENKRKINLPESAGFSGFKNDWSKIGQDMWYACQTVESETNLAQYSRDENDQPEQHNN